MEIDGLWTVQFTSLRERHGGLPVEEEVARGGVFVITDGRVLGGGISYYFVGTACADGATIELQLHATRYNDFVTGLFDAGAQVQISAHGELRDDRMVLDAFVPGLANASIHIEATRRERGHWTKV